LIELLGGESQIIRNPRSNPLPVFAQAREIPLANQLLKPTPNAGPACAMYSQDYDGRLVSSGGQCYGAVGRACKHHNPTLRLQWQLGFTQPMVKKLGYLFAVASDPPVMKNPADQLTENKLGHQRP